MKPVAFAYKTPTEVEEVLDLLAEHGDEAAVLAGGQSLVPLLNLRVARPRIVVDVNRIPGLDGIEAGAGGLRLGALARASVVERDRRLAAGYGVVEEALRLVAHPQIRNRSTIGGSAAHADPASELPALLVALDGEVVLVSHEGERTVAAHDFFLGVYSTARRPDELVTEVRLPPLDGLRATFVEVARRRGDFALAGACVAVGDGEARIALCGVAPAAVRLTRAEELARDGAAPDEVAQAVAEDVEPWDDVHGSAAYRRHLAGVVVRRALETLS